MWKSLLPYHRIYKTKSSPFQSAHSYFQTQSLLLMSWMHFVMSKPLIPYHIIYRMKSFNLLMLTFTMQPPTVQVLFIQFPLSVIFFNFYYHYKQKTKKKKESEGKRASKLLKLYGWPGRRVIKIIMFNHWYVAHSHIHKILLKDQFPPRFPDNRSTKSTSK